VKALHQGNEGSLVLRTCTYNFICPPTSAVDLVTIKPKPECWCPMADKKKVHANNLEAPPSGGSIHLLHPPLPSPPKPGGRSGQLNQSSSPWQSVTWTLAMFKTGCSSRCKSCSTAQVHIDVSTITSCMYVRMYVQDMKMQWCHNRKQYSMRQGKATQESSWIIQPANKACTDSPTHLLAPAEFSQRVTLGTVPSIVRPVKQVRSDHLQPNTLHKR
jgi:hypothetical protein